MSTYYLAVNGQPAGPYTVEQLSQFRIAPDALVWNETMTEWTPASSVTELQVLFRPVQPVYQQPAAPCRQPAQPPVYQQPVQQQTYQPPVQQPTYQQYEAPYPQPDYEPQQRIVSFIDAIKRGFINYVNFSGRASRSEYWFFQLFIFLGYLSLIILAVATGEEGAFILPVSFILGIILPNLSITWRRLHDTGRSGAYFFMSLIPFAGPIILLVAVCNASEPYENDYGPVPNVE